MVEGPGSYPYVGEKFKVRIKGTHTTIVGTHTGKVHRKRMNDNGLMLYLEVIREDGRPILIPFVDNVAVVKFEIIEPCKKRKARLAAEEKKHGT